MIEIISELVKLIYSAIKNRGIRKKFISELENTLEQSSILNKIFLDPENQTTHSCRKHGEKTPGGGLKFTTKPYISYGFNTFIYDTNRLYILNKFDQLLSNEIENVYEVISDVNKKILDNTEISRLDLNHDIGNKCSEISSLISNILKEIKK
jgi:hypothetical protein